MGEYWTWFCVGAGIFVLVALTNEGVLGRTGARIKSPVSPTVILAIVSAFLIIGATRYDAAAAGLPASLLGAVSVFLVYGKLKTMPESVQIVVWVILVLLPFFVFGLFWAFQ